MASGSANTTVSHPWLTADRGWKRAGTLHVGEPVRLLDGATVVALHLLPGVAPMWDLALDATHTFAVGVVQAVVHNCPVGGDGATPGATGSPAPQSIRQYSVNDEWMKPHLPGTAEAERSVFLPGFDAKSAVLAAARIADENNLWNANRALVQWDGPVGTLGWSGESTNWIAIARRNTGWIHGWPEAAPPPPLEP